MMDDLEKYYEEARERAKRRKSPWNLLLLLVTILCIGAVWVCCFRLMEGLHMQWYPSQNFFTDPKGIGPVLASTAPLFAAFPLGMIIANRLVRFLPAARNALDAEAKGVPGTSYKEAQRQLVKYSLFVVPPSLAIAVYGAWLPW